MVVRKTLAAQKFWSVLSFKTIFQNNALNQARIGPETSLGLNSALQTFKCSKGLNFSRHTHLFGPVQGRQLWNGKRRIALPVASKLHSLSPFR